MEIISCFKPEQAYSFCGALTIEEMLNSQRLPNRFGVSVAASVRAVAERGLKVLEYIARVVPKAKTLFAAALVLLVAADGCLRFVNYLYAYASRVQLNVQDDVPVLAGQMKNFALNSGAQEFDGNGNISLIDGAEKAALFKLPVSYTSYTVQSGDSISSITKRFGLSNISTLIAVNNIDNVRLLRSGQKLRIPSVDGRLYTVR